jgi:hypothetical protein
VFWITAGVATVSVSICGLWAAILDMEVAELGKFQVASGPANFALVR